MLTDDRFKKRALASRVKHYIPLQGLGSVIFFINNHSFIYTRQWQACLPVTPINGIGSIVTMFGFVIELRKVSVNIKSDSWSKPRGEKLTQSRIRWKEKDRKKNWSNPKTICTSHNTVLWRQPVLHKSGRWIVISSPTPISGKSARCSNCHQSCFSSARVLIK